MKPAGEARFKSRTSAAPTSQADAAARRANRAATLAFLAALVLGEVIVFTVSPFVAIALAVCTVGLVAGATAGGFEVAGTGARGSSPVPRQQPERALDDLGVELPDRRQLIDHIARAAASAKRYHHDLTLVVVRVRLPDQLRLEQAGSATELALAHVTSTLRRVTRASDFLARVDDLCFAVLLQRCSREQSRSYCERISLAVGNRPLPLEDGRRSTLYVGLDCAALQYDATRFHRPVDFLKSAEGDSRPANRSPRQPNRGTSTPRSADAQTLRQLLVRNYRPAGEAEGLGRGFRALRSREIG